MTKPFQQWKVLPHDKPEQIDDNILTVVGKIHMPLTGPAAAHDCGAAERLAAGGVQRDRARRG